MGEREEAIGFTPKPTRRPLRCCFAALAMSPFAADVVTAADIAN